jgi:hypothetical protein
LSQRGGGGDGSKQSKAWRSINRKRLKMRNEERDRNLKKNLRKVINQLLKRKGNGKEYTMKNYEADFRDSWQKKVGRKRECQPMSGSSALTP